MVHHKEGLLPREALLLKESPPTQGGPPTQLLWPSIELEVPLAKGEPCQVTILSDVKTLSVRKRAAFMQYVQKRKMFEPRMCMPLF